MAPTPSNDRQVKFSQLRIGGRYLYTSKGQVHPVTVRALLPATSTTDDGVGPSTAFRATSLVGIEYDDATRGKHSGSLDGRQVFTSRRAGAASFIKYDDYRPSLSRGWTFVEALEDRYGVTLPGSVQAALAEARVLSSSLAAAPVTLGGSGGAIRVEAPNIEGIAQRMKQIERLKSVGLEEYHICGLGAGEDVKRYLADRMTGMCTRMGEVPLS